MKVLILFFLYCLFIVLVGGFFKVGCGYEHEDE